MKEFVEYIVKHLVDNPEEVRVSEVFGETTVVYELKVAQNDMGKVIGKNGRTAHAMRVLLSGLKKVFLSLFSFFPKRSNGGIRKNDFLALSLKKEK